MNEELDTASAVSSYLKGREPEAAARTSFTLATESNPDQEAEYRRLAKQAGIPIDSVRDNKEAVQRQVSAPDFTDLATKFPSTTAYLSNLENSRVAHDDVGGLTAVEKAIRSFMDGGVMKRAGPDGKSMNDKTLQFLSNTGAAGVSGLQRASAGVVGLAQAPFDLLAPVLDPLTGTVLPENPLRRAAAGLSSYRQGIDAQAKGNMPNAEGIMAGGFYSGISSLATNVVALPMALFPGGQAAALTAMTAPVGGGAYGEARDKGLNPGQAAVYGGSQALIEYATEKLPLSKLIGDVKAGTPLFQTLAKNIALEVPGEQLATVLQDLNEWAALNPDKPFKSYLEARPGAAAQTLIATIVGAGGQVTIMQAVQSVLDKTGSANLQSNRAEEAAAGAENLTKLAEASKLRARDPESFAQFVNQVAEDSDTPTELYIDADTLTNTLNQAGITMERLAMVAPAVAAQLRAASFIPGADIRVPVAEFAAAGADITTPLIDHLRETPDAMSRAEAQQYLATEGDRIQAEVETEMAKMGDSIAARQQVDMATARFEAELNAAGRFRPEVNKAYAGMMGNFYATQAARAGMPLEDFLQKYQLRVTGKTGQGAQTLEQAGTLDTVRAQWDAAGIRNAISENGGTIELSQIIVPEGKRGAGAGTQAMQQLLAYADATGQRVVLTPSADFGGTKSRLVKFYKGLGFVENKGRAKDFTTRATMIREPKGTLAQAGRAQPATNSIATTVERAQASIADFLGTDTLPNGLGKVVVATAADIQATWEPLIGRSVQMGSEGDAGQAQAFYDPASKTVFLIADNIRAGDETAVLAHELMHKHGQDALGKAGWDKLHGVISTWANAEPGSDERAVYNFAKSRVDAIGAELSSQELFPYAVEGAIKMGVQPSKKAKQGTVARWFNDVQTAMKDAWGKVSGKPEAFDTQDLVNLAFGIAQRENPALALTNSAPADTENIADAALSVPGVLLELGELESVFQYPKSDGKDLGEIAVDKGLQVRPVDRNAAESKEWMLANTTPEGAQSWMVTLPGGQKATVVQDGQQVYINVSAVGEGNGGSAVYDLAANYAANNGLTFIGDPNGVSPAAMRRRLENMLSSAVKYGTTDHLQPHPDQLAGNPEIGVPALKWTDGDIEGNILSMVEASVAATESTNPVATQNVSFDPASQSFVDGDNNPLDAADLRAMLDFDDRAPGTGQAGVATLQRNALFRALLSGPDARRAFLDAVRGQQGEAGAGAGATRGTFYQGVESAGAPRATLNFASDITQAPSVIALLEGADLSSFLHESGHFFLEVQADLAARIQLRMSFGDTVSEAERGIVDDMNTLLAWFGVTDMPEASALDQWAMKTLEERREAHETFARGFERYAMEGKAPTQELAGLFNKFRSWLISVYQKLANLNVTLTDDVRGVMDRMLASDEAIQEAQAARNMGPLFQSPEQAGMTPKEYDAYQFLGERATAAASEELDTRLMKDMKWLSRAKSKAIKAAQAEADDIRRDTEREVRAEVMAQPVYQVWQLLTGKSTKAMEQPEALAEYQKESTDHKAKRAEAEHEAGKAARAAMLADQTELKGLARGQFIAKNKRQIDINVQQAMLEWDQKNPAPVRPATAYEDAAPGFETTKLNTDELKKRYGTGEKALWRILSERRMTSSEGMDAEVLAGAEGFSSGDEMIQKLAAAIPPEQLIAEQTDQLMMERYGDITSAEALSQAADEAVHNELRARVIATELKALQKAGQVLTGDRNTTSVLAKAAKEYAAQVIARQRVRDLRPSQYTAAEARSAKLAEQSLGKDMAAAALHKRNQLINNYAARAAYDAQDEVKAMQAYFRKFDKRRDSIDAGYQDQIEALLERFDFKPASRKAIDKRKSFAAWYDEQVEAGNPPDVPDNLLDESRRQSYKDMTVEELRGLRDTVKQIEHMGRLKNKLLLARDQRDFDAAASGMANSIIENGGDARPVELEGPAPVRDWFAGVAASHRKLASLFRQMDGNKDDGPMYDLIGRGMNERGTMEDVMVEKATEALRDIYAPLLKMRGGITGARSKVFIPEINASLTRGGRLAVALNWGNEANRQRIMDGDKWSQGQVQAILKTLTPVELKFVNDVWAYIDSYWEQIAAKEKRLTGVEPEKVQAQPFAQMAADGTEVQMTGGYYPLKYDTDRSDRADQQEAAQAAKEMMQGVMTKATTRRGHTKERLKEVKRAVRKDLNVITQHITQVTHDLAWHEWLIDTNKLLQDGRVVNAIRDHYGPKVLKTIRDDVLGIATADVVPQTDVDKALLALRGNVTRATMGASITTAFLQPFGLTQSIVRIGPQHVLRGMARWGGDAVRMENTVEWIRGKSEFMRLRAKTFNKELREIRGSVGGKSATMRVVDAGLFALMQKMQLVADVPTWVGQYEKSMAEGLDEVAAVAMADRAVLESQGGGATKDLAEVQRKHPMLTQFYSYFSVTLNLAAEQTAATDFKNPAAVAGWLGDMALLMIIPAILPSLIMFALKGGGGDDDEKAWAKRISEWQLGYLMGTVVGIRELSGAVSGFDYAGPPVSRIVTDLGKAGTQTIQGEVDEPAVMAYIRLMGTAFGIPVVQALRSYKGWKAWDEGQEGAGPQSVLFGPPPRD